MTPPVERESVVNPLPLTGDAEPPAPPPLRIHHVMLLTAVVAIMATMLRAFPTWEEYTPTQNVVITGYQVFYAILVSVGVTISGLGIRWRCQGCAYWNQPGQFILLNYALVSAYYVVGLLEVMFYPSDNLFGYSSEWVYLLLLPNYLGLDVYAAMRVADNPGWRVYFWLGAAFTLVTCVYRQDVWWIVAVFLAILTWAVASDLRRGTPRHWSHWVGCTLSLGSGVVRIGIIVAAEQGFFEISP